MFKEDIITKQRSVRFKPVRKWYETWIKRGLTWIEVVLTEAMIARASLITLIIILFIFALV